ncbi:hypothetical protein C8A03DRAFT_39227 [Achaetomium macrosporum]|uniref:Uncharacterized protein n=1 Tax=Achaetomium macrosporum TaxID=79813 RepID=A0AAN7H6A6_9PEZI|nr:hypothetical protein C8A03DRAFT_39227 [Achaetomium macrosporum]
MAFNATPRNPRWAFPISASANLDTGYQKLRGKPDKAYAYVCWCQPPFLDKDNDEDEDENEDDWRKQGACDAGKTCLCTKPAQEHPDHKRISTWAARCKFLATVDMAQYRNPDNFEMHTFTDHEAYGVMEVIENLLLDFVEADSNWREQWAVCETLAFFLQTDLVEGLLMIDDPKWRVELVRLVSRAFLAMLARLERDHRLGPNSEVRNLGLIMSLFVKVGRDMSETYVLSGLKEDTVELRGHDGSTTTHGITLPDVTLDLDTTEPLPPQTPDDPWNTAEAFRKYEKKHGRLRGPLELPMIGGDEYDITTWDAARRKKASLTGHDPFSQRELIALRMGMTMQFA